MPRKAKAVPACPKRGHRGSAVRRNGVYTDKAGNRWQRYVCRPAGRKEHSFRVVIAAEPTEVVFTPPPACPVPQHAGSTVVRAGKYGSVVQRQRYRCTPANGEYPEHRFTLALPREWVGPRQDHCEECEVLVGPHRGTQASSRRSCWPLMGVVDCLIALAGGTSHAQASLNLRERRDGLQEHALEHAPTPEKEVASSGATASAVDDTSPAAGATGPAPAPQRSDSSRADEGRAAWHLAADLVEQYSPVLFAELKRRLADQESDLVQRGAEARARGELPDLPITFVLDEVPVLLRQRGGPSRVAYTLFTVVEVWWRPPKKPGGPPRRLNRLRLARAYPGSGTPEAWWLVLHEIGTVPDVIVSDYAWSIRTAMADFYTERPVVWLPSLFHFHRGMREMFAKVPEYSVGGGSEPEPRPELIDHLNRVTRDWLVEAGPDGWATWWVELEQLARQAGAPVAPIVARRDVYRDVIAAAIPTLAAREGLPASNAGIENQVRTLLKPILRGRSQRYGNTARTNALLDLVTCADNRLLADRAEVARLLREDNLAEGSDGWATRMRTYDDPQPPQLLAEQSDTAATHGDAGVSTETESVDDPFTLPGARATVVTPGKAKRGKAKKKSRPGQVYASLHDPGLVPALIGVRLFPDWEEAQP